MWKENKGNTDGLAKILTKTFGKCYTFGAQKHEHSIRWPPKKPRIPRQKSIYAVLFHVKLKKKSVKDRLDSS